MTACRRSDYVALARLGDEEGFHTVTVGEIAGAEAFSVLARCRHDEPHPPWLGDHRDKPFAVLTATAMGFASLESLAPGRVYAGLGTGITASSRTGTTASSANRCRRCASTVEIFRSIAAGERIDRAGGAVTVRGFQLQHPPPRGVPVFLAGFQRGMLRLAGAIADGVHFALAAG